MVAKHLREMLSAASSYPGIYVQKSNKESHQIQFVSIIQWPAVWGYLQNLAFISRKETNIQVTTKGYFMKSAAGKDTKWQKKKSPRAVMESQPSHSECSVSQQHVSVKTCSIFLLDKSQCWNLPQEVQMFDERESKAGHLSLLYRLLEVPVFKSSLFN